jgi:hypothetical protein
VPWAENFPLFLRPVPRLDAILDDISIHFQWF